MKRLVMSLVVAALTIGPVLPSVTAQQRASRADLACARRQDSRRADDAGTPELPPLETQVLGQRVWLSGGPAALRVIVTDPQTGKPLRAGVALTLTPLTDGKPDGLPQTLYTGRTGSLGTLNAGFIAPAAKPGSYRLTVAVNSELGADTITQPIQLQASELLLLTADKPIYQPGQTMHVRALALNRATRQALADSPITFEIEDARGNKVYKKRDTL